MGLESSVTELGCGVDELEVDLLEGLAAGAWVHRLSESQYTLMNTDGAALEHKVVVLDKTVVGESTKRVDALVGKIVCGGGVVCDELSIDLVLNRRISNRANTKFHKETNESLANSVDLLVDLSTMVVTVLTGARNSDRHTSGMPCSNTGDLSETLVSLAGELGGSPTLGDTWLSR